MSYVLETKSAESHNLVMDSACLYVLTDCPPTTTDCVLAMFWFSVLRAASASKEESLPADYLQSALARESQVVRVMLVCLLVCSLGLSLLPCQLMGLLRNVHFVLEKLFETCALGFTFKDVMDGICPGERNHLELLLLEFSFG